MKIRLVRKDFRNFGIFGELIADSFILKTLEHAYLNEKGFYVPKVPAGAYLCRRGPHRLHGMKETFETFMLMDVPNADGILFHWGNYNSDSEGCILLGLTRDEHMVTQSRKAFSKFMELMEGCEEFNLIVEEPSNV